MSRDAAALARILMAGAWAQDRGRLLLTALAIARSDAVTMFSSTPTPQRASPPPTEHSTYAAARAFSPDVRACSA